SARCAGVTGARGPSPLSGVPGSPSAGDALAAEGRDPGACERSPPSSRLCESLSAGDALAAERRDPGAVEPSPRSCLCGSRFAGDDPAAEREDRSSSPRPSGGPSARAVGRVPGAGEPGRPPPAGEAVEGVGPRGGGPAVGREAGSAACGSISRRSPASGAVERPSADDARPGAPGGTGRRADEETLGPLGPGGERASPAPVVLLPGSEGMRRAASCSTAPVPESGPRPGGRPAG